MSAMLRYDEAMRTPFRFRMTAAQANSLHAVADAMSLTTGDLVRAAIDQWIEDCPEPRLFSVRIIWQRRTPDKPTR